MPSHKRNSQSGFTLIEILVVLGIIIAIAGSLGVPMYQRANTQTRITSTVKAIQTAKAAVSLYNSTNDGLQVPFSLTTTILPPRNGSNLRTQTAIFLSKVIDLQTVLLSAKCLEAPVGISLGSAQMPTLTTPVLWDTASLAYYTAGDVTPTTFYAGSATNTPDYTRLASGLTVFGGANLATYYALNFTLDGVTQFPDSTHIVYWIIPRVDSNTAFELAKQVYKGTVAAVGSAQLVGPIMYPAADASGMTTVYAFVSSY
jgi:prepilin-type N-terminal cleavage/methylation domain-containing protein